MNSQLVIGCRNCFEDVMETKGYTINNNGLLRLPLIVSTAYSVDDLYELFIQNYNCPYCQESLTLTPTMMGFINDNIDGKSHIDFNEEYINIVNDWEAIKINRVIGK